MVACWGCRESHAPDFPSRGTWYEVDGMQVHIILAEQSDPPSTRHVAFVVDDLSATLNKVEDLGLPIWGDFQLEGWVRKHCRDPFGNGVELLQRCASQPAAAASTFVDAVGQWRIGADENDTDNKAPKSEG